MPKSAGDELGQVGVAQRAHQDLHLGACRVGALHAAGDAQHALHRAQPPVVVHLLREQLLAEPSRGDELVREDLRLDEALARELISHDVLEVGHHHRAAAEERLEVLGQLGAAGVAGVHRDERADRSGRG